MNHGRFEAAAQGDFKSVDGVQDGNFGSKWLSVLKGITAFGEFIYQLPEYAVQCVLLVARIMGDFSRIGPMFEIMVDDGSQNLATVLVLVLAL